MWDRIDDRGPALRALVDLCRELALLEMGAVMRDALPAVSVKSAVPGVYVHVFVTPKGLDYSWAADEHRHPVSDPAGAARLIADYARSYSGTRRERS